MKKTIDLDDTEIAYRLLNNRQLLRSYFIFCTLNRAWLANIGTSALKLATRIGLPWKPFVKPTIFAQFCGGETLNDCSKLVETIENHGINVALDYATEANTTEDSFTATKDEIIRSIQYASTYNSIPFCVVKPTSLISASILEKLQKKENLDRREGEQWERFSRTLDEILTNASRHRISILVDAEETWTQAPIDDLVLNLMQTWNRIDHGHAEQKRKPLLFATLQMYRKDSLMRLERWINLAKEKQFQLAIKLVRGAYVEKERRRSIELGYSDPIHSKKSDTDRDFNLALTKIMDLFPHSSLYLGTHNELSCLLMVDIMDHNKWSRNHAALWFSQLYGMGDHLSNHLAFQGFNVAKYLPYGAVEKTIPYLLRRAEENASVQGNVGRDLSLLRKELRRRNIPHV